MNPWIYKAIFMITLVIIGTGLVGTVFAAAPTAMAENILFLGDSLTVGAKVTEWFGAVNKGVVGESTKDIMERLDDALAGHPETIILMAGINDFGAGFGAKTVTARYKRLLNKIRIRAPGARLIVLSTLPVNNRIFGPRIDNRQITELNRQLREICPKFRAEFFDMVPFLAGDDGQLQDEYTSDGVHLTSAGYHQWRTAVGKILENIPPSAP
jgi:lysophospholipase L1-like esterase